MKCVKIFCVVILCVGRLTLDPNNAWSELPIQVAPFTQQIHQGHTPDNGLPSGAISQIAFGPDGNPVAKSEDGEVVVLDGDQWKSINQEEIEEEWFKTPECFSSLEPFVGEPSSIRATATHAGEVSVAAESGLYVGDGKSWKMALPREGEIRWAPINVRATTFDQEGHLWFAAPQGVGYRVSENDWRLFTGADGLPYNDFTCMTAGEDGVWFGTTNGAIHFKDGQFSFRQGGRWLVNNHVTDIAVDRNGDAWLATMGGVSHIASLPMTLEKKAHFYEEEIEKYHRRTEYGYVNPAVLSEPGDKSTAKAVYSDNDGFNTGLYLAAMCFAYSVTEDPKYKQFTENSFRALAFLSEVTQGGEYGGPEGLIARNIIPITEPDPGAIYSEDYDFKRNQRDSLWKILERRVPIDKTGEWYWKADASSDELDGHFFGAAIYFDRVCQTEEERDTVRVVVRRIIDHLIRHDYNLVDYDGKPTRWGHFSPDDLNRNEEWVAERGLNSYSILTYLTIAHHITGDPKYREAYLELALDHGYGMNGMTQPKDIEGPHSPGHQPDDNMAFMNYYHLIRYETDPKLLSMYYHAIKTHWNFERLERNSFTNFIYAACCRGKTRKDQWGEEDLSPPLSCYEDAIDTLKRYPLDLIEWPISNAHRTDLIPLGDDPGHDADTGGRTDGYAFPIDERHETYWDWNPWELSSNDQGTRLRPGFHYLLAYYMGRYHGFVEG